MSKKRSSCKVRVWYVLAFALLSVTTMNIWALTFIRSPLYKKEMELLKRIGRTLDQNWEIYFDSVDALETTIDSYMDNASELACGPEVATIDSKVDHVIGAGVEAIGSKVDVLDNGCKTAESTIDAVDQNFNDISSKLDDTNKELVSIESKIDYWVGPLGESISSKVDIANIESISIESKLDYWVGPFVETIDSKVDAISDAFPGSASESLTRLILSKGEIVTASVNTINTSGLYTVTANTAGCITVDADNVIIDLNGFTLFCDQQNAVIEILPGHNNIQIKDGKVQGSPALDNDGILSGTGCSLINISQVKTFSCNHGIKFVGDENNFVESCKIKNCEFNTCNIGCSFDFTKNTVVQNCVVFGCYQKGFEQASCKYNMFDTCKVLNIENDETDEDAVGFVSSFGTGNLFAECVAEGVRLTNASSLGNAIGFLFERSETESKIINSIANSTSSLSTTTSVAYGMFLDENLDLRLQDSYEEGAKIYSVDWAPDSQYIAMGGENDVVRVLSFDGLTLSAITSATYDHGNEVNSVDWRHTGDYIAIGGATGTSGAHVRVLGFDGAVLSAITSATYDHGAEVYSIDWHHTGSFLAIGGEEGTGGDELRVLSFDGALLSEVDSEGFGASASVYSVDWHRSGTLLAIGSFVGADFTVEVFGFDGATLSAINSYPALALVDSVNWHPTQEYLAIGGFQAGGAYVRVLRWNGVTLSAIATAEVDDGNRVTSVNWSPDGNYLLVGSYNSSLQEIRVFSFDGQYLQEVTGYEYGAIVYSAVWSPNQRFIGFGGDLSASDPELQILNVGAVTKCLIDNNKVCNTSDANSAGVGISGDSSVNYFIRNLACDNDTNYSANIVDVYTGGLSGSPDLLDNISLPSSENQVANSDLLETIDSKVDVATVDGLNDISSKLDIAHIETISIESKLDYWIGPLSETINSKMDVVNIENISIESKLDQWVGPLSETIDSKVDNVISDLAVYTENLEELVLSRGTLLNSETSDISTSGLYTLTANASFCVTVDADDVVIDLGGFTLFCDQPDAVIEILPGHENIQVINGKVQGSPALDNDGILSGTGCSLINISNIKTFSCEHGIRFAGDASNFIDSCKIQNCEFNDCTVGCSMNYTKNTVVQNCVAFGCYQKGFEQVRCQYNVCDTCKALNIENDETNQVAIGFSSDTGTGNLFTECFAEGITKTTGDTGFGAIGFLLTGTEQESKIVESIANSSNVVAGNAVAYGILAQDYVLNCLIDNNKVCNTSDLNSNAVGISGDSSKNYFIRNLAYDNDTNYSANVVDVYTGGLSGSPDLLDNISLPSSENQVANSELLVTIESKVDFLEPPLETVSSKLDIANDLFATVESRIDVAVGPTLEDVNSKVDVAYIESVSIESKLDQWIGPLSETIASKTDVLQNTLTSQVTEVENLLISKGGIISTGQNDITKEGVYKLGANTIGNISIQTSDVIVDLCGFTLFHDSGNSVIDIDPNLENIEIVNGKIDGTSSAVDGILVREGNELVIIEDIRIFDCDYGMTFSGTSGDNIKACEIKNCQMRLCTKGVRAEYLIKSLFENCHALNCVETGFDLIYSEYNVFDSCFALETQGFDLNTRAIGFSSSKGRGNLFRECVAEGTSKTASYFCNGAIGFLLTGTQDAMEQETKIVNCIANSSFVETGTGGAFGIYVEPVLIGGSDLADDLVVQEDYDNDVLSVAWSPNSRYLALGGSSSLVTTTQELVVAYFDGSSLADIAEFEYSDIINSVDWSPTGTCFYLAIGGENASKEVEVVSFDGSNISSVDTFNHDVDISSVSWSPDGTYLAYGSDVNASGQEVGVLYFDGSSLSAITTATFEYNENITSVDWSPDGKYLAVGAGVGTTEVGVFSFNGSILSLIDTFDHDARVNSVAWSPDGKCLAYGSNDTSGEEVGILYFDGLSLSGPIAVFQHSEDVRFVSWSPDGKYLVLVSEGTSDSEVEVLAFNPSSGSVSTALTSVKRYEADNNVYAVDWSPDGRYIAIGVDSAATYEVEIFNVMDTPSGCVIDDNKACSGVGSTQGSMGVLGSGDNVYTRNIGYNNNANFNKALYNRSGDVLQNTPNYYDNIWLPGFHPRFN